MRIRLAAAGFLAALGLTLPAMPARADWTPFAAYYANVARAAAANDAGAVLNMVGTGGNPNQPDELDRTGLHICGMNGNLQIAAILIKAGAKLNIPDKLGNTPLHDAADRNQIEMAKLLIEAGAAIDPQNKDGMTPLMIAASHGNLDIVRALLSSGANPTKADYTGRDAIGWAAESRRPAVAETLRRAVATNNKH